MPRVEAQDGRPLVLALDSSGPVESVALAQGDLVIAAASLRRPRGRGSALAARAHALLEAADRLPSDLSAVLAVVGPGSFTGLRVGIATAQGLAAGLGIPTLTCDATRAWALAVPAAAHPVAVTLDARRGEVYGALWAVDGAGPRLLDSVKLLSPELWFAQLAARGEGRIVLVGDGARLYSDLARAALGDRRVSLAGRIAGPALGAAAVEAALKLEATGSASSEPLVPVYMRDHDAAKT